MKAGRLVVMCSVLLLSSSCSLLGKLPGKGPASSRSASFTRAAPGGASEAQAVAEVASPPQEKILATPEMRRALEVYQRLDSAGAEPDHVAIVSVGARAWDCFNDVRGLLERKPEWAEVPLPLESGERTPAQIRDTCLQAGEASKRPLRGCGVKKLKLVSKLVGGKPQPPAILKSPSEYWFAYSCADKPTVSAPHQDLRAFAKLPKLAQAACPKGSKVFLDRGWTSEKTNALGQVVEKTSFAKCWMEGESDKWLPPDRDRDP